MKHMFGYDRINKRDLYLIAVVFLTAAGLLFFRRLSAEKGTFATVEQDGRQVARLSLAEEGTYAFVCREGGTHVIRVQDGLVRVEEADCPDQICVRQGWIGQEGETAVCLPHRILVRVQKESG